MPGQKDIYAQYDRGDEAEGTYPPRIIDIFAERSLDHIQRITVFAKVHKEGREDVKKWYHVSVTSSLFGTTLIGPPHGQAFEGFKEALDYLHKEVHKKHQYLCFSRTKKGGDPDVQEFFQHYKGIREIKACYEKDQYIVHAFDLQGREAPLFTENQPSKNGKQQVFLGPEQAIKSFTEHWLPHN